MSILNDLKISRRHALRGMLGGVGVALWMPVLDAMCNNTGTAFAAGDPLPTTFGIFYWGNGIHRALWTPTATGDGDAWALKQNLMDFSTLKDYMTLVTGLQMMDGVFKGHGWGVVYVLAGGDGTACTTIADISKSKYGGLPETAQGTQWQPTIDQLIATDIHAGEPYKSLETGVLKYTGLNMGTAGLNLAHTGPNQPLAPERDPAKLFNRLFGTTAPPSTGTGMPIDVSNKLRRSVLDAVLVDAKRLQATVGAADSKRIDAHMDAIRSLETRIPTTASMTNTTTGSSCLAPKAPTAQAANVDLSKTAATSKALNQLIAAALSCNMTRVYSHLWSGPRDDNHYPDPAINIDSEHHTLTHSNSADNDKAASIEKFIMAQYADLAQTLKSTTMGSTTLLDQTLIYGISEQGDNPHDHLMKDYHIVLMGKLGGKVKGNRHIRKVGNKVSELMLLMQQLMGRKITSYGSWDNTSKPFNDILA